MPKKQSWTNEDLYKAVAKSTSVRQVIKHLGLIPAGGNYNQVQRRIKDLDIETTHFHGKGWRKDKTFPFVPKIPLQEILVEHSFFQSHKLKKRLFKEGLKQPKCELCGWAEVSVDGRIPIELDHINGIKTDNRIQNLRILCPNCHSLQVTHRGKNIKAEVVE